MQNQCVRPDVSLDKETSNLGMINLKHDK